MELFWFMTPCMPAGGTSSILINYISSISLQVNDYLQYERGENHTTDMSPEHAGLGHEVPATSQSLTILSSFHRLTAIQFQIMYLLCL